MKLPSILLLGLVSFSAAEAIGSRFALTLGLSMAPAVALGAPVVSKEGVTRKTAKELLSREARGPPGCGRDPDSCVTDKTRPN
ncbi:hypothetical protein GQ607_010985 [Colletotrichum asianum]|uniref:Uncharacterized protein n=1 Tax=Colletotrichum asianum TaxID=702518 RepID=A0A8H3ZPY2_9PEZI|nr:hypothetical protein GQ607_010985 [Colletotrichum asianum]